MERREDKYNLLPCPFCGGEAKYHEKADAIWCNDCSGGVEDCTISKDELFKVWNTREPSQIETTTVNITNITFPETEPINLI